MAVDLKNLCFGCMKELSPEKNICSCGWRRGTQNQSGQLRPGSLLGGNYAIGKSLGQGGFGITYVALNIQKNLRVAVKEYFPKDFSSRAQDNYTVIPKEQYLLSFQKFRERFKDEFDSLKKFSNNPYIVTAFDFISNENGTSYIITEFIDGTTFKDYITHLGQNRTMLLSDVLAIMNPVAVALQTIHQAGLIHRDISPDNIMLLQKGNAKIIDFGSLRVFSHDFSSTETQSLTAIIKWNFSPPEQFFTNKQGAWTDVYALGATIYNAITGVLPTPSINRENNGGDLLRPPTSFNNSITEEQSNILLKAMALEPKERYQSVQEFFGSLKSAKSTEPSQTGTPRLKLCKNEHFYDADRHKSCPYCAPPRVMTDIIVPPPPASQPKTSSKKSLLIASVIGALVAFVASAGYFSDQMSSLRRDSSKLHSIESELKKTKKDLSIFKNALEDSPSYGSATYYSPKDLIGLKIGGNSVKIPVYSKDNGTVRWDIYDLNNNKSNNLEAQWGEWSNDWIELTVTSKNKVGIYDVRFSNENNNAHFSVLVIVHD